MERTPLELKSFAEEDRRKKPFRGKPLRGKRRPSRGERVYKQLGIVHVHASAKNTILSLTDLEGRVKAWTSCGSVGFKTKTKRTSYAALTAAEDLGRKAQDKGFDAALIYLKGVGPGRFSSCRGLALSGLKIFQITDKTGLPHNGCRAPKKRRV